MRRARSLLPSLLALGPLLLAGYAATLPWARGSVVSLWGISRSPAATLLVLLGLLGALAAAVVLPFRHSRRWAGPVHAATGVALCAIAAGAWFMIHDAGVRAFGFISIATVRPARGLVLFLLSGLLMLALGGTEIARSRRRPRG